jgi:hypothetical protein
MKNIIILLIYFCAVLNSHAQTAQVTESKKPLLSGQALADKEKEWRSCPDGYYTGPREGRRNYTYDHNIWVVTPDFAKRFCMPEHMISTELKGAEAIAFKMVEGLSPDTCVLNDEGKTICQENMTGQFEIYYAQTIQLPAFNPNVEFYDARGGLSRQLFNSGWPFNKNEPRPTIDRKFETGSISKFKRHYLETKNPTTSSGFFFMLMYAHIGPGIKRQWPISEGMEIAYRQNVMKGLNFLALQNGGIGFDFGREEAIFNRFGLGTTKKDGHYFIGMFRRPDYYEIKDPNNKDHKTMSEKKFPDDFEHVIYLPNDFMQTVRQRSMKSGSSFQELVNQIQQR